MDKEMVSLKRDSWKFDWPVQRLVKRRSNGEQKLHENDTKSI